LIERSEEKGNLRQKEHLLKKEVK